MPPSRSRLSTGTKPCESAALPSQEKMVAAANDAPELRVTVVPAVRASSTTASTRDQVAVPAAGVTPLRAIASVWGAPPLSRP